MNSEKKQRKKAQLYLDQEGRCYYCKCKMVLTPTGYRGSHFATMATIEHLRDRFDPTRLVPPKNNKERRLVLACWRCNNKRGQDRQEQMVELQRRKSQRMRDLNRSVPIR